MKEAKPSRGRHEIQILDFNFFHFYWVKMKISFLFFTTFENGFHFYSFLRFRFFFDFIFFHFYKNELFIFEFFHTFLRTLPGSRLSNNVNDVRECQRIVGKVGKNRRNEWFMFLVTNQRSKIVFLVSLFPF